MKKLFRIIVEGYFLMKYNEPMIQSRIRELEARERLLEDMILNPEMFKNGEIQVERSVIRIKQAIRKRERDSFMNKLRDFTSTEVDQLNEH